MGYANNRKRMREAIETAEKYGMTILTAYELQPVGEYGLEEYNTYHDDGLDEVEKNYENQFSGTDVGIAFHNLNMMRKLNPAGIRYLPRLVFNSVAVIDISSSPSFLKHK